MPTENLVIRASMRDEVSGPARRIKGEIAGVGTTARAAGRGTGAFSTALSRDGRGAGRVRAVLRGGVAGAVRATVTAAASEVSFTSVMVSLLMGGRMLRTICGSTMRRMVWP